MCCRRTELLLVLWVSTAHLAISMPSEFCNTGYDPFSEATALEELGIELFEQWMVKHGKVYSHPVEKAGRFENFQSNLRYITERNARRKPSSASHVVGLNQFADLTNEEFKAMYASGMVKNDRKRRRGRMGTGTEGKEKACEAPYSLDWRTRGAVTPVKNQGQCGSCWAFSSTGAMEGINAITTGDLMSLSEQELVDCDTSNEGCNGGDMDYAFEWVINNGGIDTESNYPYIGVDATCNYAKEQIKAVTIDGYQDVDPNESSLLCAVVKQPVSVGIDGSSLDFQLYTGGIYDGDCSSNPDDIDHAVLIVGYGSQGGTDYWIVKNSWGTSWGLQGYIYIRRNTGLPYGVCAINSMASYPTKHSPSPAPFPSPAMPPPPPPPFPPSPLPSQCGHWSYCPEEETCCCLFEFQGFCLLYGCCPSENAVCCAGTIFCCPQNYPICDIQDGLCLQSNGDTVGIAAKKPKLAKHKLPWTRFEGTSNTYKSLLWKRERLEAMR